MSKRMHVIWQDYDINVDDYADFLSEEYPEVTNENEKWRLCAELNDECLEDERANLNKDIPEGIIMIADIGRWNGRFTGYGKKEIHNIAECLEARCDSMSYNRFYLDGYHNLRQDETHHDASNHYVYRKWKKGVTDEQKESLRDALYFKEEEKAKRLITRYTAALGKEIEAIYGWAA